MAALRKYAEDKSNSSNKLTKKQKGEYFQSLMQKKKEKFKLNSSAIGKAEESCNGPDGASLFEKSNPSYDISRSECVGVIPSNNHGPNG